MQKDKNSIMFTHIFLVFADMFVLNATFILSFLIRYGNNIPKYCFPAYQNSFVFLTIIYAFSFFFFRVYKKRFKSSWVLFKKIFLGLFFGTLLSIAFVYVFRVKWGAFPTGIFVISFLLNLLFIFKLNQYILKAKGRIKKRIVVIGQKGADEIIEKRAVVKKIKSNQIGQLLTYKDIDEVVICEKIQDENDLSLLLYLTHKLKIDVFFKPSIYMELLSGRINGTNSYQFLSTFIGEKRDAEEFIIKSFDIIGSVFLLLVLTPLIILISVLIKISSPGTVFYRQQRVGKDGKIFTLYKFRTMVKDAEKEIGPVLASRDDPRVTKIGKILRTTRLDELPQFLNVLRGDMSLVGPRPERPHFVKQHKALHELRLAVKPGLTGLAQIRSFYDLKPRHKIKYDYLYIQKRSLLLNMYILLLTIPTIFSRKGW